MSNLFQGTGNAASGGGNQTAQTETENKTNHLNNVAKPASDLSG